jgi:hypothetical protein
MAAITGQFADNRRGQDMKKVAFADKDKIFQAM